MTWYLEHASKPQQRAANFFPRDQVLTQTGFRSVYCFSEADALIMRKQGRSRGMRRFAVFTDELLLDFDNGYDDECKRAVQWAQEHECSYALFESGKKGMHLEIKCVPEYSLHVPHSQALFVEKVLKVASDASLYRHNSLYRLPGTLHQDTGNPKRLVDSRAGERLLKYKIVEGVVQPDFGPTEQGDLARGGLERVLRWHGRPPKTGQRYQTLWSVAKLLKDAGFSSNLIIELVTLVNTSWGDRAKEEDELRRVIREVT